MAKSGKKERPNVSVEASIARLDKIVERLESEETDLSEAIELFREGNELAKVCRGQLEEAELLVKTITESEGAGDS